MLGWKTVPSSQRLKGTNFKYKQVLRLSFSYIMQHLVVIKCFDLEVYQHNQGTKMNHDKAKQNPDGSLCSSVSDS